MKREPLKFEGYGPRKPERRTVRFEEIIGSFATTTGTPTWTPKSLRDSIAVDAAAPALYIFTDGQWVAIVSA
jgi:hypothetical protein